MDVGWPPEGYKTDLKLVITENFNVLRVGSMSEKQGKKVYSCELLTARTAVKINVQVTLHFK